MVAYNELYAGPNTLFMLCFSSKPRSGERRRRISFPCNVYSALFILTGGYFNVHEIQFDWLTVAHNLTTSL